MGEKPVDEAGLLNEARRGSEQAFLILYRRHRTSLFRFVWRMADSSAAAEDINQECFLELIRASTFDAERAPLQNYLFGIARNLVFRRLRISGREVEELVEAAAPGDVLEDLLLAERSKLVQQAVAILPALQREAIIMFEYEEFSLERIAAITCADVGAVKARLRRARESLRKRLAPLFARDAERSCS